MPPDKSANVRPHEFQEVGDSTLPPREHLPITGFKDVRLHLSAEVGQARMMVRDVLQLHKGSVIALNKPAGEPSDILLNGMLLARGEVVVINEVLHVRISEVFGMGEKTNE